ncbi:chromate transporter [Coprobacter tertius]|uniref:Chromate transporter n=1 Tax=Coprobacter tertius TaxID=2944915 RepID=A0ABT1MF71_9BACT|nr:chromate transporter [Coprobacter tertius]MCP9611283.1 chromate transporter [Coprobacter tertius]
MGIYPDLFFTFFKIGAFTFGGGWAMISIIEKEVVDKHKWLSKEEFLDALAISQSLPGILAVNISIMVGNKLRGTKGSIIATLGTVLPSFVLILLIAMFFSKSYNNPVIERIFKGIRPAVVALIVAPVLTTAKSARINIKNIWIPAGVALLIWLCGISPVYFVLAGGVGGIVYYRYIDKKRKHQ